MVARSPPGGSWGSILDPAGALPKQPYKAAPRVLRTLVSIRLPGRRETQYGAGGESSVHRQLAPSSHTPPPFTPRMRRDCADAEFRLSLSTLLR